MPAPELRICNRAAYFRKAITSPDFCSNRVLARDAFEFAELWLKRSCADAVPYWKQAREYFKASQSLPALSSPLTTYYCFLNATKALLIVKGVQYSDTHGVHGAFQASKRSLQNEKVTFQNRGILGALSKHLDEKNEQSVHSLKEVLSNLPYIHRAFRYTFQSHPEMFIPIRNLIYRKNPETNYVWIEASIDGRSADGRVLRTLPKAFEIDEGYSPKCVIRTKQSIKWYGKGASNADIDAAQKRLHNYHRKARDHLVYIAAQPDLWYIKRSVAGGQNLERHGLTLAFAAMHRLSELSRYDPRGLNRYLDGRENWLLTEFIELAPTHFMDELVCEMTSLEFGSPGIRPR